MNRPQRTVYRSAYIAALKERRWRRRQSVLLMLGVALLALAGGFFVGGQWAHVEQRAPWLAELMPLAPRPAEIADARTRPVPRDNRLVIADIRLDAAIHEGAGSDTLGKGIWHQPNGASPATQGNTVLAGHRLKGAFLLLDRLAVGDEIAVFWKRTRHLYAVTAVTTAEPDDDAVLRCGSTAQLTLYTCVPRHSGDKRVVVVAAPIAEPSADL